MMRVLLLRFSAPLMSFGAVRVDARGPIQDHPGLGLVTGLLANALGYDHAEADRLTRLQERLRIASRCDRPGTRLTDYQTVDLGQDFMIEGWTTRGAPEGRKGGTASEGTHIRHREFHADRVQTVAVMLSPAEEAPTLDNCGTALDTPARPLFLGRKPCLPAGRLNLGVVEAESLLSALANAPRWTHRHGSTGRDALEAWWPEDPDVTPPPQSRVIAVVDERDWRGQVVVGRRLLRHGRVNPPATPETAHA
jgi:CRISPR system Cascade subunit CasD